MLQENTTQNSNAKIHVTLSIEPYHTLSNSISIHACTHCAPPLWTIVPAGYSSAILSTGIMYCAPPFRACVKPREGSGVRKSKQIFHRRLSTILCRSFYFHSKYWLLTPGKKQWKVSLPQHLTTKGLCSGPSYYKINIIRAASTNQ